MKTVKEIVEALGGIQEAAYITNNGYPAVAKWVSRGVIPDKHWAAIIRSINTDIHTLYSINERSRAKLKRKQRSNTSS